MKVIWITTPLALKVGLVGVQGGKGDTMEEVSMTSGWTFLSLKASLIWILGLVTNRGEGV